jgi:hypothetical protein
MSGLAGSTSGAPSPSLIISGSPPAATISANGLPSCVSTRSIGIVPPPAVG